MAYSKQTWVDGNLSYPVSAARMGTIENGIEAAAIVADQGHRILTTTQRDALGAVTVGTMIYNSTTQRMEMFDGSDWNSQIVTSDQAQTLSSKTLASGTTVSDLNAATTMNLQTAGSTRLSIDSAGVITANNLVQRDTGWNNMNLTAYDANWTVGGGQYRKMPDGFVVFRSLVKISTGTFFTLPVGYRPSGITYTMHLCAASGGIARIDVASGGQMYYAETKAGTVSLGDWTDLSGIRFWAG